jgi:peptidoglycan/LPS O-acetylase OafA/YrhL
MGILRLLLALSVVIDHQSMGAIKFGPGGEFSVQCFYIISGFYISLVLDRTYSSNGLFWANRGLRLFPSYWAVAVLTPLILPPFPTDIWAKFLSLPIVDRAFVVFSNGALFGQDWMLFLGFRHGHMSVVSHFQNSDFPLYQLLLVPPAWSLGVELSFYALAPFILRRGWGVLLGCLLASLGLRLVLAGAGLSGDPWSYRFFPNELATFLLGCVAYRIYRAVQPSLGEKLRLSRAITVGVWVIIACVGPLGSGGDRERLFSLALVASTLPFLSIASRSSRLDRFLGDLSYPIYICHWLGMRLVNQYMNLPQLATKVALTVAAVIVMALALKLCIDQPIEILRSRLRDRSRLNRMQAAGALPALEAQH